MANWDYVFPLSQEAIDWLDGEALPHPELMSRNRMPSTREISDVVASLGEISNDFQIDLDFDGLDQPEECFKIRGDIFTKLKFLQKLANSCGQLWMYPDTGEIAVIVDTSLDPDAVGRVWHEASERDHDWQFFYRHVYATEQSGEPEPPTTRDLKS